MSNSLLARLGLTAVALTLTLGLAACGDDGDNEQAPTASDVPTGVVAVVGDEQITKDRLDEQVAAIRSSQPKGATVTREQLRQQALAGLLQQVALDQEAKALGVKVTNAEVSRRLAQAKRQFPSRRAYKRFLGKQPEADLLRQLRAQLLAERVYEAASKDSSNPKQVNEELRKRWTEKTACAEGYVTAGCGNASN